MVARESIESDRKLAIAWAQSTGLVDVPSKPHKFNTLLCIVLALVLFLLGGIIYWLWCQQQEEAYNSSVSEAVAAWRANGSPNPYEYVRGITQISPTHESNTTSPSLTEKLTELAQLRDSGILTEEEFQLAKKNELNK